MIGRVSKRSDLKSSWKGTGYNGSTPSRLNGKMQGNNDHKTKWEAREKLLSDVRVRGIMSYLVPMMGNLHCHIDWI